MSRDYIGALVIILIIVVAWIGFDLYHAQVNTDFPEEYIDVEPIDTFFDEEYLNRVNTKRYNNLYNPFDEE